MRLFGCSHVRRAGWPVKPGFALAADAAEPVVRLWCRLDEMPLAIELTAAWVRSLSPQEILRRLDDRFSLLTGGNRDALARQQTRMRRRGGVSPR